jgi:amino acid transporter
VLRSALSAARIGEGCVLVFFAFMGTEGALTVSGEVIYPARTVPRAIALALTIVAILYIGAAGRTGCSWPGTCHLERATGECRVGAEHRQLPRARSCLHPKFGTPAVSIVTYTLPCALVAWTGSFRALVIVATSGTLLLYLICCLGLLRLRAKRVETGGEPFRAPGGPFVPIAASAIIVWMLTTLELRELAAAFVLVVASGTFYWLQPRFAR